MLGIRDLKAVLIERGIRPSKKLGQNFLIDRNIRDKIIDAVGIQNSDTVLEIGPGLGVLTESLCERAKNVIAIEKDSRLCDFLKEKRFSGNLELITGDILEYNFTNDNKVKVLGNLPYYISSPILIHLLGHGSFIDAIFITVQKEFAERLTADTGDRLRGAISYFAEFYGECRILFYIKKRSFYPVPDVDSCFLRIGIRNSCLSLTDERKLFTIIRASFSKRRKMILNSLQQSGIFESREDALKALKAAGISPEQRPEQLSLQEFMRLANAKI